MWAWIEIWRPGNCVMSAVSVAIGAILVSLSFSQPVLLAAAAALLITAAGNAVNDVLDVEADRTNRPKRPVPSGRMSRMQATILTLALFTAGIVLSALTGSIICLLIASFNSILLVAYSAILQHKAFLGNASVSFLAGSTFIFGGAAAGNASVPIFLALLSGLATFSREIVKDLQDVEGDRKSFMNRRGKKGAFADRFRMIRGKAVLSYSLLHAAVSACVLIVLAVGISAMPYALGIMGPAYLAVVAVADAIFAASVAATLWKKDYALSSKLIKFGMLAGLLAFLAGALY